MTDKQSKELEILNRIDELDLLEHQLTDTETITLIALRKKALR